MMQNLFHRFGKGFGPWQRTRPKKDPVDRTGARALASPSGLLTEPKTKGGEGEAGNGAERFALS